MMSRLPLACLPRYGECLGVSIFYSLHDSEVVCLLQKAQRQSHHHRMHKPATPHASKQLSDGQHLQQESLTQSHLGLARPPRAPTTVAIENTIRTPTSLTTATGPTTLDAFDCGGIVLRSIERRIKSLRKSWMRIMSRTHIGLAVQCDRKLEELGQCCF